MVSGDNPKRSAENHVRQPLVMEPRRVDRFLDVHRVVDHIQDGVEHGVDDRAATGTTGHHDQPAAARHDGRRHARQHPLARCSEIGRRAYQPACRRQAWPAVEIAHLVVEQEPRAWDDDARTVGLFERVGQRDRITVSIDDGQMRRFFSLRSATRTTRVTTPTPGRSGSSAADGRRTPWRSVVRSAWRD